MAVSAWEERYGHASGKFRLTMDDPKEAERIMNEIKRLGDRALSAITEKAVELAKKYAPVRGTATARTKDTRPMRRKTMTTMPGELRDGTGEHGGIGKRKIRKGKHQFDWALVSFAGYGGIVEKGHTIVGRGEAGISTGRRKGLGGKSKRERIKMLASHGKKVQGVFYIKRAMTELIPKIPAMITGMADR